MRHLHLLCSLRL